MNQDKLFDELKDELNNVIPEKRIQHIKQRLLSISDPDERNLVESIFLFLKDTGLLISHVKPIIVAMVHGIRTRGEWHDKLKVRIESTSSATVKPIRYGYFDAFSFWLPVFTYFRTRKVKHITSEMRLLKRDYPNHEIVIVAHSFGTYLTAKFLKNNIDFNIERLLLCGSILPENYSWGKLPNFPNNGNSINDIGTKDIWPVLAKTSTFGYGASGTFGFNTHLIENRYYSLGHSDFFTNELFDNYWLPFILNGKVINSEETLNRAATPWYLNIFSLFSGQALIMLICFLFILFL